MSEYSIPLEVTDTHVAFDCEADRAEKEQFKGVAMRQRAKALHIRNAYRELQKHCPEGYGIKAEMVFTYVLNVNPVLRDEYRT